MQIEKILKTKSGGARSQAGTYISIAVLIALIFFLVPGFKGSENISNIICRSVPLLAVAIGQTLVLLTSGIDLSVGATLSLSTALASTFMQYSIGLGAASAVLAGLIAGLVNGIAVTKLKINPFLVTLSTNIIIGGIALFIRPYPGGFIPIEWVNFITFKVGSVPSTAIIIFVLIVVASLILLKKTVFGRHLYAVGGNFDAARLAGINADRVLITAYVLSGFCAAIGGLYMTARMSCGDPNVGNSYQMESITAAVLGGTALTGGKGGTVGTVLGVILVVMLGNIFNLLNFNIYWQQVIRGIILLLVVGYSEYRLLVKEEQKLKKMIR